MITKIVDGVYIDLSRIEAMHNEGTKLIIVFASGIAIDIHPECTKLFLEKLDEYLLERQAVINPMVATVSSVPLTPPISQPSTPP